MALAATAQLFCVDKPCEDGKISSLPTLIAIIELLTSIGVRGRRTP